MRLEDEAGQFLKNQKTQKTIWWLQEKDQQNEIPDSSARNQWNEQEDQENPPSDQDPQPWLTSPMVFYPQISLCKRIHEIRVVLVYTCSNIFLSRSAIDAQRPTSRQQVFKNVGRLITINWKKMKQENTFRYI